MRQAERLTQAVKVKDARTRHSVNAKKTMVWEMWEYMAGYQLDNTLGLCGLGSTV
jgi:hypothetical protein